MQSYPSYRYRDIETVVNGTTVKDIEAKRVDSPEDEAQACPPDEGWRHSPDPQAQPSVDPASLVRRSTVTFEAYPSYRYRKHPETGALETITVESAKDAAEHAPSDAGWVDSPGVLVGVKEASASSAVAPPPVAPSRKADLNTAVPASTPDQDVADAAAMHAMRNADVIATVTTMVNEQDLIRAYGLEQTNPRYSGGRRAVLNAINARMAQLVEEAAPSAEG